MLGIDEVIGFKKCTSKHALHTTNNKLDRDFTSLKLGENRVSEITYIRKNDDWNYLVTIIDLADRKIVESSLSEDITTQNTVMAAWMSARNNRNIIDGFTFH